MLRTLTLPKLKPFPSPHAGLVRTASEPESETETGPGPAPARRRGRQALTLGLGLTLVLGLFSARCAWITRTDSITSDEVVYLLHGLHWWETGDDLGMWELGTPRLPHLIHSLPSYLALKAAGMLPQGLSGESLRAALNDLVLSGSVRVLHPARWLAIGWGVLLLVLVFAALARTGRPGLGLVAASLVALVPEVVAHTAIAGSDMAFTATALLALILLTRYVERPTAARWLGLALSIGLAWAMRHTGLVLLGLAGLVHLACGWRRSQPRNAWDALECLSRSIWAGAALAAIAFGVLWAGDGFGLVRVSELARRVSLQTIPQNLGALDLSWVPIPSSLLSVLKQVRHQNAGHEAFFCGAVGTTGWPLYFPVAFLLKTPLGLLALLVLAAARVRPRGAWDAVALAALAILWFMLVRNKVDIGLRYALLTYPLAATFAARLFAPELLRDRLRGPLTLAAAAVFAWASLSCGTRCLSYFNEIGGGPQRGWLYLADSNVDWGQDFDALGREVLRLGITEVTTDVTSERRLELPGVLTVTHPPKALQVPAVTPPERRLYDSEGGYQPVHTRYVAASVTRLYGLYSQNDLSWLRTRKVVSRVGDSIFLFDMDTPADVPFFH